jgi:hypothetical protein
VQLTKLQRRSLGLYLRFRDEQPTLSALVKFSWWRILLISAYCLIVTAFFYFFNNVWGMGLMLGILIGFLSSAVAQIRLFLKIWPAVKEVLDWTKVRALLEQ